MNIRRSEASAFYLYIQNSLDGPCQGFRSGVPKQHYILVRDPLYKPTDNDYKIRKEKTFFLLLFCSFIIFLVKKTLHFVLASYMLGAQQLENKPSGLHRLRHHPAKLAGTLPVPSETRESDDTDSLDRLYLRRCVTSVDNRRASLKTSV